MKKPVLILFFAAFVSVSARAQSIQDGIMHYYAQRYQSAKTAFEKLLAANPNNIEATYWLGQTYIAQKNIPAAESVYQKALAANGNAPLLMAGMGHVELLQGKANEARSRFENAINASRGKKGNDPNVLNAVGRANVQAYREESKLGDLDYAITKLTEASQLAPNNPDIFLNLGNAYRKKGNKGSEAIQAYRQAQQINPSFAIAPFRAAMLFKTQVSYRDAAAWSIVLENLNAALAADPKFAPAYEELYYYNLLAKTDFPTAENMAKQYISHADPTPENSSLEMQIKNVQKKYSEVVSIGKNIISQTNNNARPIVYRIMAVAYMGLKDTTTACDYINQFFGKATDDDILVSDYIIHAETCGNNNSNIVMNDLEKALQKENELPKQIKIINEWIDDAKANGQKLFESQLRMKSYQLRKAKGGNTYPIELITYGTIPHYLAGEYQRADSLASEYIKLAPDSIWGYYWGARAQAAIDTSMQQGLAILNYEKALQIALTDTNRFNAQGVLSSQTLAIYYANIKKEYPKALEYTETGLRFDPANANLLNIKRVLSTPRQSPQKNNTSTNQAKDTKVKTGTTKTKVKKG